ncbi:MAG: MFS transporter [Pseudomonadota bacterium]
MMVAQFKYWIFYAFVFLFLGVQLPFISGLFAARGMSAVDISIVLSASLIGRIVLTPFAAMAADQAADRRGPIVITTLVLAAGAVALAFAEGFWATFITAVVALWAFGAVVPMIDVAAMEAQKNGALHYGRARGVGSAAFVVANIAGGALIGSVGYGGAGVWMAASAVGLVGAALILPRQPVIRRPAPPRAVWKDAAKLFTEPAFVAFLCVLAAIQGAHATYYGFSILHWSELGYSQLTIGVLWAVGVVAEIVILMCGVRLGRAFGIFGLFALGAGGAALRWTLTALEPPLAALVFLQTLHGLTFAATHLGTVMFVQAAAPERIANTAMTTASATGVGAATGLATLGAGWLFQNVGAGAAYGAMAAMGLCGLMSIYVLKRIWRGAALFA